MRQDIFRSEETARKLMEAVRSRNPDSLRMIKAGLLRVGQSDQIIDRVFTLIEEEIARNLQATIHGVFNATIAAIDYHGTKEALAGFLRHIQIENMPMSQQPLIDEVPGLTPEQADRFIKLMTAEGRLAQR